MIHIITGPTHCGKSTYINSRMGKKDLVIDILDHQKKAAEDNCDMFNICNMKIALYNFYLEIEDTLSAINLAEQDLWIEGSFSNKYRIGQIIDTILAARAEAEDDIKIEVIYLFQKAEFYEKYCDFMTSYYSMAQQEAYTIYKSDNKNIKVTIMRGFTIEK